VNLIKAASLFALLCVLPIQADYIYEANQNIFDLTNQTGTTNMASGDDQVSGAFNLDFTFTFYGEDFTSARMATNGCLHFGSSGGYCNDYTPDPLPEITYTLYPFWTDLIRDNGSKVLAKNFTDKSVFGWYNLREYNRASDNTFEVILWKSNDSFEFRYGGLNIINHDVLIGEQGKSDELYTYLYHDQCGKGSTNVTGTCVSSTWNQTAFNTLLENGGSLYGVGSGNALDCSNPLNNSACVGYDAAYLTQQCDIDGLYSSQCPNYWDDLFDYECSYDAQYSPACPGYMVETYEQETYYDDSMYGYDDDQYGYTDPYYEDEYYYEEEPIYFVESFETEYYLEEDYSFEDEMYYEETIYFEEEYFDPIEEEYIEQFVEEYDAIFDETFIPLSYIEERPYIEQIYDEILLVEEHYETNYDIPVLEDILLNHFEHEEHIEEYIEEEPIEFLEFETIEELEEWIEHEENEEALEELVDTSEDEISDLEDAETIEEESQDREENIELVVAENEDKRNNKRAEQLNVVANTIRAASNSVRGTTAGTSAQATGTSISSGGSYASAVASGGVSNAASTAVASSSSGGGISTSNSPSISAQVASSAMQTQQVLSMSVGNVAASANNMAGSNSSNTMNNNNASNTNTNISTSATSTANDSSNTTTSQNITIAQNNTEGASSSNATGSMELEINTAMSDMSASEADSIAEQIIAQNIQGQQEELEQEQQETGEYADSTQLVALMGYVPGFNNYRQVNIPNASIWYEPKDIYTNVSMSDNNQAFFSMFGNNLTTIKDMIQSQPNL